MSHRYDRREEHDGRQAAYAVAVMATVYALLLDRVGVKKPTIHPLNEVFA